MKNIIKQRIWGLLAAIAIGFPLHFLYEWTGDSRIVALFAPINESIWEHLKIVFYAMLLVGIVEYIIFGKRIGGFVLAKTLGIICAMAFTVIAYYTYSGITGQNIDFVNIAIYVVAVIFGYIIEILIEKDRRLDGNDGAVIGIVLLIMIIVLLSVFTFNPPQIPLFEDPDSTASQ